MWNKLRHLDILPGTKDTLHDFGLDKLNFYFAVASFLLTEYWKTAASILKSIVLVALPSDQLASGM